MLTKINFITTRKKIIIAELIFAILYFKLFQKVMLVCLKRHKREIQRNLENQFLNLNTDIRFLQ